MEKLLSLCANFIKGFTQPINYTKVKNDLESITQHNYDMCNIPFQPDIRFEEIDTFGTCGKVLNQGKTIVFNKKRLETLINLNIDCFDENHLNNLWNFYDSFNDSSSTSKYQKCLYAYMQKYISLNVTQYFSQMGSVKNIPFELIETLIHENQHVFQQHFWTMLLNGNIEPTKQNATMIFTMTFQSVYNQLKNNNIENDYVRENYIFPIEFDARYTTMHILYELYKKHFNGDKIFYRSIVNSNIIPDNFDIESTVDKMFDDYLMVYEKFQAISPEMHKSEHDFICSNKHTIVQELKRRYSEMLSICNKQGNNKQHQ